MGRDKAPYPYVIITDSSCDMTQKMVDELALQVIPLVFTVGGKDYFNTPDNKEMPCKKFYGMLRDGEAAVTSMINISRFVSAFEPILREGKDLLYIGFSSALSGTFQSACAARDELAEKYKNRKILVVDSLSASLGQGLLLYHCAMKRREGYSVNALAEWALSNRLSICHWFTVDDLFFLKRGGRVSATAALFGTMLGIKPVMHVDDEGRLIQVSKVRGRRKSLDALVQNMENTAIMPESQTVFISHGDCEEDAQYVASLVREKFRNKDITINFVGPVIGSHSGPGTVALFFVGTKR